MDIDLKISFRYISVSRFPTLLTNDLMVSTHIFIQHNQKILPKFPRSFYHTPRLGLILAQDGYRADKTKIRWHNNGNNGNTDKYLGPPARAGDHSVKSSSNGIAEKGALTMLLREMGNDTPNAKIP